MKKIILAIFLMFSLNLFSQTREKTVTFNNLVDNKLYPVTGLTIDSLRLIDVSGGTYNGYVIYPDNVTSATLTNNGNGQYVMKTFTHSNFSSTIGSGYKYYVKLQRKIGATWTDQNQYGYFWIGDFGENIDRLQLSSDTANNMRLWKAQTAYGLKTFSDGIKTGTINPISSELYIGTTGKTYMGNSTYGTPMSLYSPMYANSVVTRGWTQTEINTQFTARLNALQDSTYQESQNIIRLIPDGIEEAGRVYLTYSAALTYARTLASSTRQMTVVVSGMGTAESNLAVSSVLYNDTNRCAFNYVHFKALGYVVLNLTDMPTASNTFGSWHSYNTNYDGFTFYMNCDEESAFEFKNITFSNCTFIKGTGTPSSYTFTSCRFLGANYFYDFGDNIINLANCIGTPVYANYAIAVTGTNMIPYATHLYLVNPAIKTDQVIFSNAKYGDEISNDAFFMNTESGDSLYFKNSAGSLEKVIANGMTVTITFPDNDGKSHTIVVEKGSIKSYTKTD